jgi:Ankyrin repeat.
MELKMLNKIKFLQVNKVQTSKVIKKLMLVTFICAGLSTMQVKPMEEENFETKQEKITNACETENIELLKSLTVKETDTFIDKVMSSSDDQYIFYKAPIAFYFCKNGYLKGVQLIYNNIDSTQFKKYDYDQKTPLFYACENGHLEIIEFLYEKDKTLFSEEDIDYKTPIFYAFKNKRFNIVKFLYEKDPNLFNKEKEKLKPKLLELCECEMWDKAKEFITTKKNILKA